MNTFNRGFDKDSTKGSTGTKDYVDANFGGVSPKAFFAFGSFGTRNASTSNVSKSIALADASTEGAISVGARDGQASSDTFKQITPNAVKLLNSTGGATLEDGDYNAFSNNTVTLNYGTSNGTEPLNILMLGGSAIVNAEVQVIDKTSLTTGTNTINAFGFTPDCLIVLGLQGEDMGNAVANDLNYCLGLVTNGANGLKNRSFATQWNNSEASMLNQLGVISDTYGHYILNTAGTESTIIFNNFGGSGDFDAVVGTANLTGDVIILAIELASDHDCDIIDIVAPASTGNQNNAVSGMYPRAMIGAISPIESYDSVQNNSDGSSNSLFGFVDNSGVYGSCDNMSSEYNTATSNTDERMKDDVLFTTNDTGTIINQATPSFSSQNVTLNWDTANDAGHRGIALLIGEKVSGRKADFMPFFLR